MEIWYDWNALTFCDIHAIWQGDLRGRLKGPTGRIGCNARACRAGCFCIMWWAYGTARNITGRKAARAAGNGGIAGRAIVDRRTES